jgi:photosystem II stability/assembly factor-like uncharacterized protein
MKGKNWLIFILLVIAIGLIVLSIFKPWSKAMKPTQTAYYEKDEDKSEKPSDWFYRQRAYPNRLINEPAHQMAFHQALTMSKENSAKNLTAWIQKGPTNIGGRITSVALHPTNSNIIYAGAADGGVLKSIDGGVNWSILTDFFPTLSIGDVTIDPNNSNTIYAGMGEANLAGDNYDGDGLYRSTDDGVSWTNIGLSQAKRIGRVIVHPTDPNVILVAAAGAQFSADTARGVYRTINGGTAWEKVLFITDSTSAIDLRIHPTHPDTVYACIWERMRSPTRRKAGGPTSGIYRSTDMGTTWSQLTNGLPSGRNVGRIGIDVCRSSPNILYAIYADSVGNFYRVYKTTDGGNNWAQTSSQPSSGLYSNFGWYFGQIRVNPNNSNIVFVLGVNLYRTTNGGTSWSNVSGTQHVDHHALEFNLTDPNHIVDGNDGGVYYSNNGGSVWTKSYNLPISQFYAATIDEINPQRTYGGTQDNGTLRTNTGSPDDWEMIYGGDGFYSVVDYTNANIIYAEYQYGGLGKSTDGGNNFFDATNGISSSDRENWSTPVIMDPNNHLKLYYGANRLYRTVNGASNWTAISSDLTNGPGPDNLIFGTITTIAVARTDSNVIYVGTDDDNVWVTTNGGTNWTHINEGLPNRWITWVAADPNVAAIAYVTLSGYRIDSPLPHVFRTTNYGEDWTDISANLPEGPVNAIVIDPENTATLYVGTDFGVYYSTNTGGSWSLLGTELPFSAVDALMLHNGTRKLRAATHGRSVFEFDLTQIGIKKQGKIGLEAKEFNLMVKSPVQNEIRMTYTLAKAGPVKIVIFDQSGRMLQTLIEGNVSAGKHELNKSVNLPNGTYFVRLNVMDKSLSRKIEIVR